MHIVISTVTQPQSKLLLRLLLSFAEFLRQMDHPSGTNLSTEGSEVRLMILLCINAGKRTNRPSRQLIGFHLIEELLWIIRLYLGINPGKSRTIHEIETTVHNTMPLHKYKVEMADKGAFW